MCRHKLRKMRHREYDDSGNLVRTDGILKACREVSILQQLSHENVIKILQVIDRCICFKPYSYGVHLGL